MVARSRGTICRDHFAGSVMRRTQYARRVNIGVMRINGSKRTQCVCKPSHGEVASELPHSAVLYPPAYSRISENNRGKRWWPGVESNHRHEDFQSTALPTELPGHRRTRIKPARPLGVKPDSGRNAANFPEKIAISSANKITRAEI